MKFSNLIATIFRQTLRPVYVFIFSIQIFYLCLDTSWLLFDINHFWTFAKYIYRDRHSAPVSRTSSLRSHPPSSQVCTLWVKKRRKKISVHFDEISLLFNFPNLSFSRENSWNWFHEIEFAIFFPFLAQCLTFVPVVHSWMKIIFTFCYNSGNILKNTFI